MSLERTWRKTAPIAVTVLLGAARTWGCGGGGEEAEDPAATAKSTATAKLPRPESIMDVTLLDTDGSPKAVRLPVDQLVVLFDRDAAASQAEESLERMIADYAQVGLRLVGRIPSLGVYQLEFDNPETEPQAAVARLDELIGAVEGYAHVRSATHNVQVPGSTDPSVIVSATANSINGAGQTELWLAQEDEIIRIGLSAFQIGTGYPIRNTVGSRNRMLVTAGSSEGERYAGHATSGTLTFDECEITTRSLPLDSFTIGMTQDMIAVEVSGWIEGVSSLGAIATDPIQQDVTYQVEASFTKCFALSDPDPALLSVIEQSCLGGYQWTP